MRLLKQPRVLNGNHGLLRKCGQQGNLPVTERSNLRAVDTEGADQVVVFEHGHDDNGTNARQGRGDHPVWLSALVDGPRADIVDMNDPLRSHEVAERAPGPNSRGVISELLRSPARREGSETAIHSLKDNAEFGIAEPRRVLEHRLKNRLERARRTADQLEHLRRGGLVFQSLLQLPCSRLLGFEQPRVLDGDDGLVGEGFEKLYLSIGKWAHLTAAECNCPDCFASADKGGDQYCVEAKPPGDRTDLWIFVRLRLQIGEVNCLSVEDCTPHDTATRQGHSASPTDRGNVPVARNYAEDVAFLLQDRCVVRVAEGCR